MTLTFPSPPRFSLRALIRSHGWSVLSPFSIDAKEGVLTFAYSPRRGNAFRVVVTQNGTKVRADVSGPRTGDNERTSLKKTIRNVLRLDADLSGFYRMTAKRTELAWIKRTGAGRMLRSPSVFEDTVKMICTTNCSWSLTTAMTNRLTETLGEPAGDRKAFPSPETMAGKNEKFYRDVIKAGYRAPYLLELARKVTAGDLNLERLRNPDCSPDEKRSILDKVMGVGPYASDNILRLHDVYDFFAHDSWIRPEYSKRYHNGRKVSDRTIEKRYHEFGSWKGLVYWLDMTRPWYEKRIESDGREEPKDGDE